MKERHDMIVKVRWSREVAVVLLTMALIFLSQATWADDLTGADRFTIMSCLSFIPRHLS